MSLQPTAAKKPTCRILFRSKDAVELFTVPTAESSSSDSDITGVAGGGKTLVKGTSTLHTFSPNGDRVLIHMPSVGVVLRKLDEEEEETAADVRPFLVDTKAVQYVQYSPLGTYIVTWERPTKPTTEGETPTPNLKIWNGDNGTYLHGFHYKVYPKKDSIPLQWSFDESYAFFMVTNELRVYPGQIFSEQGNEEDVKFTSRIRCVGIGSFSVPSASTTTTTSGSAASGGCLLSTFVPETKGKPARISLLQYPTHLGTENKSLPAVSSKSFYQAEEVTVHWSPKGDAALILSHTTVDTSGESYYGSTQLYLLLASDGKGQGSAISVPLPSSSSGPVLDVGWMPNPNKPSCFIVISGKMPALSSLHHGTTGEPIFLFGNAHRNTVCWSPHGRFVTLAGFGNLAGGMDYWDRNKLKKIPRFSNQGLELKDELRANCAVEYGWSPNSRNFFVSTTSPRMNVDNGVRLYKYNGLEITNLCDWDNEKYKPDKLLEVEFVPASQGVYEDRPQSPPPKRKEGVEDGDAAAGAASAAAQGGDLKPAAKKAPPPPAAAPAPAGRYVPPAARRAAAGGAGGGSGGTSLADRMRREREGSNTGATHVTKTSGVVGMTGTSSAGGGKKNPPGLAPASSETKSKSAQRRERQRQNQAKAKAAEAAEERLKLEQQKQEEESKRVAAAADPEKRAKKIKKVLKQIDDLKTKDVNSLNDDQKKKLGTEMELREELEKLGL